MQILLSGITPQYREYLWTPLNGKHTQVRQTPPGVPSLHTPGGLNSEVHQPNLPAASSPRRESKERRQLNVRACLPHRGDACCPGSLAELQGGTRGIAACACRSRRR